MIISVGYRVKSKRGITFRRWANRILKDYLIQGYALNQKRLDTLKRVIEVQNKMLASTLDIDSSELEDVIKTYTNALDLLDDYDRHKIEKPAGDVTYVINTSSEGAGSTAKDGRIIRRAAIDNNIAVFTCLNTVKILLDVLDEISMKISTIDRE